MKNLLKKFFYSFVWIIILVFVVDIVTKWAVMNYYTGEVGLSYQQIDNNIGLRDINQIKVFPGFLHIAVTLNQGAAWSLLTSDAYDGVNPILIVFSVVLSGVLIFYYVKEYKKSNNLMKIALCLMIAGALGNMIDRIFYRVSITGFKGVIDWIYVAFMNFPTFNIADSALVVGAGIILVMLVIEWIKESIQDRKDGKYDYSPKELKERAQNEGNKSN